MLDHVDQTVEVMAPLGPQLRLGIHTRRVVEEDMRGLQSVSRPFGGTTGAAMRSNHSLQWCG
jgi:hypothetical protein